MQSPAVSRGKAGPSDASVPHTADAKDFGDEDELAEDDDAGASWRPQTAAISAVQALPAAAQL